MLLDNCNAVTIDLASHYATVAIEGFIEVKQVQILCGKHTACQCFTICVHIFQQFSQLIWQLTQNCTYPATAHACLLVTAWIKSTFLWTVARSTDRRSPPWWGTCLIDRLFTVSACVVFITAAHVATWHTSRWHTLHGSIMTWIVMFTDLVATHSNASWTDNHSNICCTIYTSKLKINTHNIHNKLALNRVNYFITIAIVKIRLVPGWQWHELAFQLLMHILLSLGHTDILLVSQELVTLQPTSVLWVTGSDSKMPRPVPTRISCRNNSTYLT